MRRGHHWCRARWPPGLPSPALPGFSLPCPALCLCTCRRTCLALPQQLPQGPTMPCPLHLSPHPAATLAQLDRLRDERTAGRDKVVGYTAAFEAAIRAIKEEERRKALEGSFFKVRAPGSKGQTGASTKHHGSPKRADGRGAWRQAMQGHGTLIACGAGPLLPRRWPICAHTALADRNCFTQHCCCAAGPTRVCASACNPPAQREPRI